MRSWIEFVTICALQRMAIATPSSVRMLALDSVAKKNIRQVITASYTKATSLFNTGDTAFCVWSNAVHTS